MYEFITKMVDGLVQYAEFYLPILAILTPIAFIIWQTQKIKKAEIEFKIYEQRRGANEELLTMIFDSIKDIQDPKRKDAVAANLKEQYPKIAKELMRISSEDVLKTYSDMMKAARAGEPTVTRYLGDLFLHMRKDLGIKDKDLSNRRLLGVFITDIDDPKYDGLFRK